MKLVGVVMEVVLDVIVDKDVEEDPVKKEVRGTLALPGHHMARMSISPSEGPFLTKI